MMEEGERSPVYLLAVPKDLGKNHKPSGGKGALGGAVQVLV